ncbi:hypothetical protein MMC31_005188, partial [Peltigera leucophlebia]|nr:hypothetical protein [Peltigera leucophlebia]
MPATSHIPPEILSSILDHLPPKALAPLRTVSNIFLDLINPRIFSKLNLRLDSSRCSEKDLNLIKSFSSSSSSVCSFIKTVRNVKLYTGLGRGENDDDYFINVKALEVSLSEDLAIFLTRLQNLETF